MLRSVEVKTALTVAESPFHNLHWRGKLSLALDCFICQRTGRTTTLEIGAERAICSGDSQTSEHYTAARIATFDHTQERLLTTLRTVVDYWWAPFHDDQQDEPAASLTRSPWVRVYLSFYCPEREESGDLSTQTNEVRPTTHDCNHCSTQIARSEEAPHIRLLT